MTEKPPPQCSTCPWYKERSKFANMIRYKDLSKGVCHLGPPINWKPADPDEYCPAHPEIAGNAERVSPKPPKKPCPACDGNGSYYIDPEGIKFPIHTHHHEDMREETCETCEGTGEVETK